MELIETHFRDKTKMTAKKALLVLEHNLKLYQPFFYEWAKTENCSLNQEDLAAIEFHIKNKFKLNIFETLIFNNQTKSLKEISAKLIWDYQSFKEWIITNFLFDVLKLVKEYKSDNEFFMHLPFDYVRIPYELKARLRCFKINSFHEIFENFNEEDFYLDPVFNNIIEFELTFKKLNIK
ncbi:MAG: hypothetical protein ABIP51_06470 [Bacteroidia bacterium]